MIQIYVKIDAENLVKLKEKKGYLERPHYPEFHEKYSAENEVGSFMDLRFILEENG